MRFLHLADVHLDTPFGARSDRLRDRLRRASREALRAATELALEEEVDALLIAGDLFDGERLSFATEQFLLDRLEHLTEAGIQVVYATGNHDPGRLAGRIQDLEWPPGVTVVDGPEPERIWIEDAAGRRVGRVTAAGHESSEETRDLASAFPSPDAGVPEVGLLHTQVVGARESDAHDPYAPSELEVLARSGYDYWALGHVHLRQRLSAEPPIWYPGNLQGRNPRETGAKGGLLVDVPASGAPEAAFRPLAPVRWERVEVGDLEAVRTLDALAGAVAAEWEAARADDPGLPGTEWILRVELRGPARLHRELGTEEDRHALEEELAARLGLLEAEVRARGVHPPVRPAEHRDRQDVLGEALRLLRELEDDDALLRELRPDDLAATPADEVAYLRSLLEGLDAELASRMLAAPDGGDG